MEDKDKILTCPECGGEMKWHTDTKLLSTPPKYSGECAECNETRLELCYMVDKALYQKQEKEIGYHLDEIKKGTLGELSKISEELSEAIDAEKQGCNIMVLIELSDLYGAIEAYLKRHYPTMTMNDLERFSDITKRAFKSGARQ